MAVFDGSYVNNKKEGLGVMTYPDGSSYEGLYALDISIVDDNCIGLSEIFSVNVLNFSYFFIFLKSSNIELFVYNK